MIVMLVGVIIGWFGGWLVFALLSDLFGARIRTAFNKACDKMEKHR